MNNVARCVVPHPLSSGGFAVRQDLKGEFVIPAPARHTCSPPGLADYKSSRTSEFWLTLLKKKY